MKKLIALSVVAGIATIGAVSACSSGSPPQSATPSTSATVVSQQEMDAVQQWAHINGLPVTRALQNEFHGDVFAMAYKDSTLALNDATARAPEADLEAIYAETVYQYQQAAADYLANDYQNGSFHYEEAGKDYVQMLALLDNEYGMNLSGAGNP